MKLIDTYNSIDKRVVYDCRVKSIMELMRHYGVDINEYEILLISRAISFNYDKIYIPNIMNKKIPYATASNNDIVENFLKELNLSYVKENIGDSYKDWSTLKELIDNDIPVLFKIDSRFLNDTFDENKNKVLNLYYLSTLLLVGYDEEKEVVYVVLTNTNETETVTELSIDKFNKYRNTKCMPFGAEFMCYYLENNNDVKNITRDKINNLITKGIYEISKLMLDVDVKYNLKIGAFNGTELYHGIVAMKQLKNDIEIILSELYQLDKRTMKFIMIFIRNNLMFGSHNAFRSELSKCLEYFSKLINDEDYLNISLEFKEIAKLWGNLFVELTNIANEKSEEFLYKNLKNVIETLEIIILREEEQFKLLNNYSKNYLVNKSI